MKFQLNNIELEKNIEIGEIELDNIELWHIEMDDIQRKKSGRIKIIVAPSV